MYGVTLIAASTLRKYELENIVTLIYIFLLTSYNQCFQNKEMKSFWLDRHLSNHTKIYLSSFE